MTRLVTPESLRRIADIDPNSPSDGDLVDAIFELGPLAGWWFRDEYLERAKLSQPALGRYSVCQTPPSKLGYCWVLAVLKSPLRYPRLRECLVFPLCWRKLPKHSTRLPPPLRLLADQVLDSLKLPGTWRLDWADGFENLDLSAFTSKEFSADSGWASLAGGLLLADKGIRPRSTIWASGAWSSSEGIIRVDSIPAKLNAAERFGCEVMFLPDEVKADADNWKSAPPKLQLRFFPRVNEPNRAMGPYLVELGHPPSRRTGDPLGVRSNYYLMLQGSSPRDKNTAPATKSSDYYWNEILDEVAEKQCGEVARNYPGFRATNFATIVSKKSELVALGARITRANRCLLFYTRDLAEDATRLKSILEKENRQVSVEPFHEGRLESMSQEFCDALMRFMRAESSDADLVLDMTPGKKSMTLALAKSAPSGCHFFYLGHDEEQMGEPNPESLRVLLWRSGT